MCQLGTTFFWHLRGRRAPRLRASSAPRPGLRAGGRRPVSGAKKERPSPEGKLIWRSSAAVQKATDRGPPGWTEDLNQCVRKRKADSSCGHAAAVKRIQRSENADHKASYQHGVDLDNALKQSLKKESSSYWVPDDPDRPPTDDLRE